MCCYDKGGGMGVDRQAFSSQVGHSVKVVRGGGGGMGVGSQAFTVQVSQGRE